MAPPSWPSMYDKAVQLEMTDHVDELIERKRCACQHRGVSQLTQAIPAMADFLARAATKGQHLASMTRVLSQMLDHYGAQAMQAAVASAHFASIQGTRRRRHGCSICETRLCMVVADTSPSGPNTPDTHSISILSRSMTYAPSRSSRCCMRRRPSRDELPKACERKPRFKFSR